jgi:hypothetical protein
VGALRLYYVFAFVFFFFFKLKTQKKKKKKKKRPDAGGLDCNLNYLGGWDQGDHSSRPA